MARYMRTDLGAGHSRLSPPTVLGTENVIYAPIQGRLHPVAQTTLRIRQRRPFSRLRPPQVVTAAATEIFFAGERLPTRTRRGTLTNSQLLPPTVVFPAPGGGGPLSGIRGRLTYGPQTRPTINSQLYPPTVVFPAPGGGGPLAGIRGRLTYGPQLRPTVNSQLLPPAIVFPAPGGGDPLAGIRGRLAYSPVRRPRARSRLAAPTVVAAVVAPRFFGPQTHLIRIRPRRTFGALGGPVVVTAIVTQAFFGPATTLARSASQSRRARSTFIYPLVISRNEAFGGIGITLVRRYTPPVRSTLRPVPMLTVAENVIYAPIQGRLHPVAQTTFIIRQRRPFSRLGAPRIVATAATVFYAGQAQLVRIRPRRTATFLRAPRVVFLAVELSGPEVTLVRRVARPGRSRLAPPTVVLRARDLYELSVTSVAVRTAAERRRYRATHGIRGPLVIFGAVVYDPIQVQFAPQTHLPSRREPFSRLRPPTVVAVTVRLDSLSVTLVAVRTAVERPRHRTVAGIRPAFTVFGALVSAPILVRLAPSTDVARRRQPLSRLRAPIVVQAAGVVFSGPATWLAYSRRGTPKSSLNPPTVIDLRPQTYFVQVNLTYSRRGAPQSFLRPATVVFTAVEIYGPEVTLAPSKRGTPQSFLRPPVVIDLRPQTYYLSLTLVRNKPQPTFTLLRPSMVTVALPRAERELRIFLTYSRRGAPKSVLRKPLVIDLRPQTRFLNVNLAYSRRGRPESRLTPPAVVGRLVLHPIATTLAYSRRGRPESKLQPPVVVRVFAAAPTQIHLTYSRRGRPVSALQPPTVIFPFFARPLAVTLTYSLRGKPKSVLRKPLVVRLAVEIYGPEITLTYSRRGAPKSLLQPPTVVQPFFARPTVISLAYSLRGKPKPVLRAPVVVYPAFFAEPISVTFARNKPQPTWTRLQPPTVISDFRPDQGDVCGTDEAGSTTEGLSSAGSTIDGSDGPGGAVCGTDEQNV